jgi:Zn-dependent peptidase ImmA (M78 family)
MSTSLKKMTVAQIRDQARNDANKILEESWEPGVFPVDPILIARDLGVSVFEDELGENVWGMLVGSNGNVSMFLDQSQPPKRFRFTCAHELGHFYHRREEIAGGGAIVDHRNEGGRGRSDEIYANEFAASLLMPEYAFRKACREGMSDMELMRMFDVSLAAVVVRRKLLGE